MPLSEHEQRLLSQMEQQLSSDDPRFASTMRGSDSDRNLGLRIAVGVGGTVLGLGLLLLAVSQSQVLLGVLAFLVMLVAAFYAFAGVPRFGKKLGVVDGNTIRAPRSSKARKPRQGAGVIDRLEDRWNRRRESGDF